jgi:hypothetical protein
MSIWVRSTRRGREHTRREEARTTRGILTHAAGCTEPDCVTKSYVSDWLEYTGPRVAVPRSLRAQLGWWIGGKP